MKPAWIVAALVVAAAFYGCDERASHDPDAGRAGLELGEPCADSTECASGLCVASGPYDAVCSRGCEDRSECPGGHNWGCVRPEGDSDLRVCGCVADAPGELCADGADNDCDGRLDDCMRCGDVLVAGDDDEHCGACFVACAADEQCRGRECRCRDRNELTCGGTCVDVTSDAQHCGACGVACDAGDLCVGGVCECPPDRPDRCGDTCADLSRDPLQCGACGTRCATGLECIDGRCACPPERPDRCGDTCVDTTLDGDHCGGCANECASGLVCRGGACECTGTTVSDFCEGIGCVDFRTDLEHCGGCGNACPSGLVCRDGACACATTSTPDYCPGAGCVDLTSHTLHCGTCGSACAAGRTCRAGVCACASASEVACGGECVDPRWDARHCGGCGIACRPGERCESGACACPSGLVCDGSCVPIDTANCGGCGISCGVGQVCSGASCRCPSASHTTCPSGCFDLSVDAAHCGACGNACGAGQTCAAGTCVCPSGLTWCDALARCVDLARDSASCGSCGNVCPSTTSCSAGACVCPFAGQLYCDAVGACVDTRTSNAHCGACDAACPAASVCSFGSCVCPSSSQTLCGTECVLLSSDARHCGACDAACGLGMACVSRACRCTPITQGTRWEVTSSTSGVPHFDVAANDTHFAVVYSFSGTGNDSVLQLLDESGAPVGPAIDVTGPELGFNPSIVWTGSQWAVASRNRVLQPSGAYRDTLVLQLVDPDGTLRSRFTVPADLSLGNDHTLVYSPIDGFALLIEVGAEAWAFWVLGDGSAPGPRVSVDDGRVYDATAVADPAGGFTVVYVGSGILYRRVEPDGSLITSPRPVTTTASIGLPDLVVHDGEYWLASRGTAGSTWTIQLSRGLPARDLVVVETVTGVSSSGTSRPLLRPRVSARRGQLVVSWQREATTSRYRVDARRYLARATGPAAPLDDVSTWATPVYSADVDHRHGALLAGAGGAAVWMERPAFSERHLYVQPITVPTCEP